MKVSLVALGAAFLGSIGKLFEHINAQNEYSASNYLSKEENEISDFMMDMANHSFEDFSQEDIEIYNECHERFREISDCYI